MPMTMPNNAPMAPTPSGAGSMGNNTSYQNRSYFSDFAGMPAPKNFHGYFIQSEDQIVPKSIPMDGSIAFFPYQNLSKIVIKQWDANGINTLTYVPVQTNTGNTQPQEQQSNNGDMLPLNPTVSQRPDPFMETLQNINNGLATTFGQVNTTLQAIQQEVNQVNERLTNAINGDLGGRG